MSDIMADNLSTFKNTMVTNRKIMSKELLEETCEHFKWGYSLAVRGFWPFLDAICDFLSFLYAVCDFGDDYMRCRFLKLLRFAI